MKFGEALELLNDGHKITRSGWNGKRMFLYLIKGSELAKGLKYGYGEYRGEPVFDNFIVMKTANNKIVPWLASQTDMLAEDWEIIK
ncbi:DUF2829 domain-containing protein [Bacillus sp. FSL W8-0940]|uniref:DUF2829 domain-containing protein n=1 Tax=Bacillus sp. FSL W8-0940 TaxID=2954638 RepID=UPI0030F8F706